MALGYRCKYFCIEELVSPEILDMDGVDNAWESLDESQLVGLDLLRMDYAVELAKSNPKLKPWITINDWKWKGQRSYCGARPDLCGTGARKSMHKERRAYDLICARLDILKALIRKNHVRYGITRMERDSASPTWAHVDNKPTGRNKLHEFKP